MAATTVGAAAAASATPAMTPSTPITQRTIGIYLLLAVIAAALAFLTSLQSGASSLHQITIALVVLALVAGIEAAVYQYRKTGSAPGAAITIGTLLGFIEAAGFALAPSIFASGGNIGYYQGIGYAITFLVMLGDEVAGIPLPSLSSLTGSPKA